MVTLTEIPVRWASENSPGGTNYLYFGPGGATIPFIRASIATMFTSVAARLDSLTTWTVATSGDQLDDATGTLVGAWADGTARTGTGSASGQPVQNQSQILLRWQTNAIVNGRRLRGRTYVPGASSLTADAGQVASAAQAAFTTAANQFVTDCAGQFLIWHRPVGGLGGSSSAALSGSCWEEFAVQRRRR